MVGLEVNKARLALQGVRACGRVSQERKDAGEVKNPDVKVRADTKSRREISCKE